MYPTTKIALNICMYIIESVAIKVENGTVYPKYKCGAAKVVYYIGPLKFHMARQLKSESSSALL